MVKLSFGRKSGRISPIFAGLLQTAGITLYVVLIVLAMVKIFFGLVTSLLLICFSALVCIAIAFGYPMYLLVQKKTKEAGAVFLWTVISMFVLIILLGMFEPQFGLID